MVASPAELTASELELRAQVREFLAETLPWGTFEPGLGMGAEVSPEFSAALAERGWIGMAVPARYGGHDATAVDRFVVVEELLRWGAPVGHHWVADRQIAQVLLRYGTEEQKQWLLPRICRGELCFCIGMSEPDAGSDLASVRTRGVRDTDGWRVSGVKVWTSNAMRADFMIALCRTGDGERHAGLSRFLIDMRSPGVTVTPIPFLNGSTDHFAEVVLDDVLVPHDRVIGEIGQGWAQNADELAFERSGPDRWISTFLLVQEFLREHPERAATTAGSPAHRRTRGPVLGATPALADRGPGPSTPARHPPPKPRSSRRWAPGSNKTWSARCGSCWTASSCAAPMRRRSNDCYVAPHWTRRHSPSGAAPPRCCAPSPPKGLS